jgi:hypothetical protein
MDTCLDAEPEPAAKRLTRAVCQARYKPGGGDLINRKSNRCNYKDRLQIHRRRKAYKKNAMLTHARHPRTSAKNWSNSGCQVEVITMCKYHIPWQRHAEYPFSRSCKKRRNVSILVQYARTLDSI